VSNAKFSKKINPLEGVLDTLFYLTDIIATGEKELPSRRDAMTWEINDQVIDTVCPTNTKTWETGIKRNGEWIIVEQYPDRSTAIAGHSSWIDKITSTPDMELEDCDVWGINDL